MELSTPVKIGLSVVGVGVIASVVIFSGILNPQFTDGGVDVRNTKCEDIAVTRITISNELENRKLSAQEVRAEELETISDAYWAQNQKLEAEYHQCISAALTADPCKEPFQRGETLYTEIMADFDAGKGFNEAKFNEREQAKKEYNKCVEGAQKPEFYKDKETACANSLSAGRETNQADRSAKEAVVKTHYDEVVAEAQSSFQSKSAILDEIEKKCNEAGGTKDIDIGAVNTGGTGTAIKPNSSACTGVFEGNDPALRRRIANAESQLQKAKAAGLEGGLYGTTHLQEALDELKQELKDSQRTCKVDADCGDPQPICCTGTQTGRAYCSNGVCASETKDCTDPEICAGKPAMCVAPDTGVQQQEGVYISKTIPEAGACSQNLQVLNLKKASEDSNRYAIVGNIPSWLHIDKPSGTLPSAVNVTYSCNTVQEFGSGVYTVGGSITVYNSANQLINTIPFNVSITVTGVEKKVDVIEFNGKYVLVSELHVQSHSGCDNADHWHASKGYATATDGTKVSDPGPQCGYGKVKDRPVIQVTAPKVNVEIRGLESLKTQ